MTFSFISNSARELSALVQATDSSDVATDTTRVRNIVGGPRHLSWVQSGTAARRLAYINKTNALSANAFVMTRADRHVGHEFRLRSWASYPSTSSDIISSTNWNPTLVGLGSKDFIATSLTIANVEAMGIVLDSGAAGAYAKTVSQLYFGTALFVSEPRSSIIEVRWERLALRRQVYQVRERRTFAFEGLTRDQTEALQNLPSDEPVFIYDSIGAVIVDKLYHCILTDVAVSPASNDRHHVTIEVAQLRHYAETPL